MEKRPAKSMGNALIFLFSLTLFSMNSLAAVNAEEKSTAPRVTKANNPKAEGKAAHQMALQIFRAEKAAYDRERRKINSNFRAAISKARAKAAKANVAAQTQMQKRKGIVKRKDAIMAAIIARDSAIGALGEPPVRPLRPKQQGIS